MADKIITAEEYNLLPNSDTTNNIDKAHYLPYEIGQSTIGLSASVKGIFGIPIYSLLTILKKKISEKLAEMGAARPQTVVIGSDWWKSKSFVSTFIPRIDTTIELSKPGIYDTDRLKLGIADSQSANAIDISRHGKNLAGLIRRTGNNELQLDYRCNSVSDLIPTMSKISDGEFAGYVVYKREYSIFNDFLKVRYSLTYDFNQINEKIGIVREKRIYNIPLESDDTPIFCKRYMILSLTAPTSENNAFLHPNYMRAVLDTLRGVSAADGKIKNILFNTPESFVDQDGSGAVFTAAAERFAIPALGYAAGNTINIMANPLDNYSVGYSRGGYHISLWGGGVKMLYNPYSDINGENVSYKLRLAGGLNDTSEAVITALPKTYYTYFTQASDDETIYYKKDRSQRPVFFQSFEVIPSAADYGNIVIGNKFCANNFLINDNVDFSDNMYLYVRLIGAGKYRNGDNKIKNGYIGIGKVKDYFTIASFVAFSGGAEYAYIISTYTASVLTGDFAIGDTDHNLFLAVNQRLVSGMRIYLQIKKLSEF